MLCFCRLLRGIYVTVADYRDVHSRILFYFPYECPVGFPGIHLAAGAPVYCEGLDPGVLEPFGQLDDYFRVLVPSQAGLDCNGKFHGIDHHPCDFHHLVRFAHHSGACSAAGYLADRTAEIYVDEVGSVSAGDLCGIFSHSGGIDHRFRDIAVDLNAYGSFIVICDQFCQRLLRIADQSVGRNEFSIHHVGPELLAHETERCIGHILHRSQKQRLFPQVYVPYFHQADKILRQKYG